MSIESFKKEVNPLFEKELERAITKHPDFPGTFDGGLAIMTEEFMELAKEINDCRECAVSYEEALPRILAEALQVSVTAQRLAHLACQRIKEQPETVAHWSTDKNGNWKCVHAEIIPQEEE